jgi:hypothetical protein
MWLVILGLLPLLFQLVNWLMQQKAQPESAHCQHMLALLRRDCGKIAGQCDRLGIAPAADTALAPTHHELGQALGVTEDKRSEVLAILMAISQAAEFRSGTITQQEGADGFFHIVVDVEVK